MATPQLNPLTGIPLTDKEKKAAKVQAVKESMSGITKVAQEGASVAAKQPAMLKEAFGKQEGATKLGIQTQLAQQLAQQEGMGAGYNKAAARQAAATAGTTTGMALGQIGVQTAKEVGTAEQQAIQAKQEAAGQLYEQLTGEQKLEKEFEEGLKATQTNLTTKIDEAIMKTKSGGNDDEEAAINNLVGLYAELKDDFTNNPNKLKELAKKMGGIYQDAIDSDWEDIPANVKEIFAAAGYTKSDFDAEPDYDY